MVGEGNGAAVGVSGWSLRADADLEVRGPWTARLLPRSALTR
jgi:hypothetical protein